MGQTPIIHQRGSGLVEYSGSGQSGHQQADRHLLHRLEEGLMIPLSSVIKTFKSEFLAQYRGSILPGHLKALAAMARCRTPESPQLLVACTECAHQVLVPHSCGHRNCPHCQHHESQQWLERQLKKQVPAEYFLLTFTLPVQFRSLAWHHQRLLYSMMIRCSWQTLRTFALNDRKLHGVPGAIAVLHTHSRELGFHPHVHVVMPAAAIDPRTQTWRTKQGKGASGYLFSHTALAKVFRAKLIDAIAREGLPLPASYPSKWVVHCKSVGSGGPALVYLGRYLYRGVIAEKDIVGCQDGKVTFRYQHAKTGCTVYKTVTGPEFLWRVVRHVLPKGFRRARNFGFLHPNSKRLIALLQWMLGFDPRAAVAWIKQRAQRTCSVCGGPMRVIATQLRAPIRRLAGAPT